MNKIYLLSHGLDNKYVNEVENIKFFNEMLKNNNVRVAIIPNAKPQGDLACALRTQQVLAGGGVQSTIIDLNNNDANLLKDYNCIYLSGGDPDRLLNVIKTKVGIKNFKKLIEDKIIIGQSAGSMILSSNFINYTESNNEIKIDKFIGLGLNNFNKVVVPHYGYLLQTSPNLINKINEFCNINKFEVLELYDKQCYEIKNSEIKKLW